MSATAPDLERARATLAAVSADLLQGFRALERRARRVERELVRANAELEAVLGALPTGVVVRDAEGRIQRANPAALALMGVAEGDLCALDGAGQLPGLEGPAARGVPRAVRCHDGARRVLAARSSAVQGPSGGSVELLEDHTELTELAERVHALDKLAALGNVTGGVAHELRNPMNAVRGFAALLVRALEPGSREGRFAERIVAGMDEVDGILSAMMALAAPERLVLESLEPCALFEEALHAADAAAAAVEIRCDALHLAGDRVQLRQALRNLIANAVEVQGPAARIALGVRRVGNEAWIEVADGGPGFPEEVRRRAFEPFFTTRPEGTGLGLALVAAIARLHGGRAEIDATPAPLGGALVRIVLPLAPLARLERKAAQ